MDPRWKPESNQKQIQNRGRSQEGSPGALGTILGAILEDLGTLPGPIFFDFGEDLRISKPTFTNHRQYLTEHTPTRGRNSRKRRRSGRGSMKRPRGLYGEGARLWRPGNKVR